MPKKMEKSSRQIADAELARQVVAGQSAAFDQIVQRYCRPLTSFAYARTGTFQDAQDIVQETFLRAFKNIGSFDSKYSLKNWLFTIAYRLVVTEYRKKRPELLSDEQSDQLEAEKFQADENQWVWHVAHQIGNEAFTALWLRYKQNMTTSEIAQTMNKSKIMIRVLLHRSRIQLAKKIAQKSELKEKTHWIRSRNISVERSE